MGSFSYTDHWRRMFARITLVLALLVPGALYAATATASLDRTTAMAGEPIGLNIAYEGGRPRAVPPIPRIAGLQVQYLGSEISAGFNNNGSFSQFILKFQITAAREGVYAIPSIQSVVDGVAVATQPLTLTISKNAQIDALNNFAFVKLNIPRKEVYLGELIPIEIQLYIINGEVPEMPELKNDGFVISKTAKPTQTRTQLNGQIYNVVTVPMSVSAAKAGALRIGPASWNVVLHLAPNRRQNSPFDDIFGPRYESRQVTLLSETNLLTVLPIPRNAPAGFSGTIGNFRFTVEASPTNLIAGDPITLHFRFAGKGTLDSLSLPQFDWPEFKIYPPTSNVTNTDTLGLEGTKTFEQIIVPQTSAVKEIPAFNFSYFDPEKKRFETVSHPAISLAVQASPNPQQPSVAVKTDAGSPTPQPEPTDIVHIKSDSGKLVALTPPLAFQPWFLSMQILPVAAWCLLLLNRKRIESLANDPKRQRRLRVSELVKNSLKELEVLAAANRTEEFFASTFRILQEQLGERLELPAASITEAVLDEPSVSNRVPADQLAELRQLFSLCNQARYARDSKPGELTQLVPRIRTAIAHLQELA
ncbi:MAG: hypothetical protein JWM99_4877 [Verrucomicrobiales bacterium]|nr:hypothetical protein [Verrucomicrobiales bacterium]